MRKNKGMSGVLSIALEFIVVIVALGMVLPIGLQLTHSTSATITPDSTWSASENSTLTSIQTNTQTGYSLFGNAPLLAAAGGIIGLIFVAFGFMLRSGGGGI